MKTRLFLIATLMMGLAQAANKPLVETDLNKVYGAGVSVSTLAPKVKLNPGVYVIGDEDSKLKGTHYLIVDEYSNDADKGLALMVEQSSIKNGHRSAGQFYMIKSIKGGTKLMLSPVFIDMRGNLSVQSELNSQAQVLVISIAPQAEKLRYPYQVVGQNGALGGELMGMRAKSDQNPTFRPWPQRSVFKSETQRAKLVVSGTTVGIYSGNTLGNEFELVPLNGDFGKMAALTQTRLDTMAEDYVSDTAIKKLAFFMNLNGEEVFLIAQPSAQPGQFVIDVYGQKGRTFLDYVAPGKLNP